MRVESLIRRKHGTQITLGSANKPRHYHFQPEGEDPRHLCEVKHSGDIATLLAIPEGYRLADLPPDEDDDEDDTPPLGQDASEITAAGLSPKGEVADNSDADESEQPEAGEPDQTADEAEQDADTPLTERQALAEQYKAEFRKEPPKSWSAAKIREALSE